MANYRSKNLRNMTVVPGDGKDAKDTQLVGLAKPTKAFNATNDMSEYETGSTAKGPLGGENTNS